jgi:hypothetical protein
MSPAGVDVEKMDVATRGTYPRKGRLKTKKK